MHLLSTLQTTLLTTLPLLPPTHTQDSGPTFCGIWGGPNWSDACCASLISSKGAPCLDPDFSVGNTTDCKAENGWSCCINSIDSYIDGTPQFACAENGFFGKTYDELMGEVPFVGSMNLIEAANAMIPLWTGKGPEGKHT